MNTAIYLRKSRSEEQQNAEETLARHKKTLLEYAEKKQLNIIKLYEESIVSGDNLYSRPQMQQLLEDVDNDLYDAVLCMDIDRLGRGNMREQGLIIETFKYSDTLIITPDKTYNLNDDTDEELTEFKTFFARRELKTINKRLQRGLKQTIKDGGYVANAPYGYKKVYVNKKPTLEIIENEAYFVRMMFDMYLNGTGAQTISEELNRLGAKPRRSDNFNRNTVRHILKNPVFSGKIVWDRYKNVRKGTQNNEKNKRYYNDESKWIIVDGLHPAIIDEETFNRAQEIRKKRYIPSQNKGEIKSTLAGLVICKKCGQKMQRQIMKGQEYLLCNKKGCTPGTKYELVEKAVIEKINNILTDIDVKIDNYKLPDLANMKSILDNLNRELILLKKQKNSLHDLLEQGIYDVDTFSSRMDILTNKILPIENRMENLSDEIKQAENTDIQSFKETIVNVLNSYESASISEKNILLKSIIKSIKYSKENIKSEFILDVELNY